MTDDYLDDVKVEKDDLDDVHEAIDSLTGGDGVNDDDWLNDDEQIEHPEPMGTVMTKYRVEAEIPRNQVKDFESYRSFFGRHVAWSNFPRSENLAHIDAIDAAMIHDRSPMLRHLATDIKIKETSIFQMCRANEKRGGFEAELAASSIATQSADVRHHHLLPEKQNPKKGKILGFIPRRNK